MDRRKDFKDWGQTIKNWKNINPNINNQNLFVNLKSRYTIPCMYKIIIEYNEAIPDEIYSKMLNQFFNISVNNTDSKVKNFKIDQKIIYGSYVKEVAESKISSVMDFINKFGFQLQCTMNKDTEYVIKES